MNATEPPLEADFAEVIGDPIDHSKSPVIHRFWLDKLGLTGDYRRTRVGRGALESHIKSRTADAHWRGCNVTMPLKLDAIALENLPGRAASEHRPRSIVVEIADGRIDSHR